MLFQEVQQTFIIAFKSFLFITYNNGNLSLEKENKIKGIRNLFRLKTGANDTAIKDIKNRFSLEKETKKN